MRGKGQPTRRSAKPAKAKVAAKLFVSRKASKNGTARVRDLETSLAAALKREAEALEQQTATSEILRVISQSPPDVQPVFDAVAASSARLCEAVFCGVFRVEDDRIDLAAHENFSTEALAEFRRVLPAPLTSSGQMAARAIRERTVINIGDIEDDHLSGWTSSPRYLRVQTLV